MRTHVVCLALLLAVLPRSAHAQRSELEAYVGGWMGVRGGVGLTNRWLLQLGAGVLFNEREARRSPSMTNDLVVSLSLGTKVYLRDPLPDSLVPFLRVLGSIGVTRVGSDCCAVWGRSYGAFAGGGATYFLGERVGLGVEVGLRWDESSDNLERRRTVSGVVAVLVTLRLGTDTPRETPPPPVAERRRRPIAPADEPLEATPSTTAPAQPFEPHVVDRNTDGSRSAT